MCDMSDHMSCAAVRGVGCLFCFLVHPLSGVVGDIIYAFSFNRFVVVYSILAFSVNCCLLSIPGRDDVNGLTYRGPFRCLCRYCVFCNQKALLIDDGEYFSRLFGSLSASLQYMFSAISVLL